MKPLLLLIISNTLSFALPAQVKIGDNAASVNPNTVLELESTSKGLLLPRLSTPQINAMSNPPRGMIVFNNTDSSLYVRRDTGWSVIPVAANTNSKTLYWANSGNNISNSNIGRVDVISNDGMIAKGNYNTGNDLTETGTASKMIWYPKKAAFRAGYVNTINWDNTNIGHFSSAFGFNTRASNQYAMAMGNASIAIGLASVAMGEQVQANGNYAVALGRNSIASGVAAFAFGDSSTAVGYYSMAGGLNANAAGDQSVALGAYVIAKARGGVSTGLYNDIADNPDPVLSSITDRIFQVGNGSSIAARSNALTVLRNGNTGIGITSPTAGLHIVNDNGFIAKGNLGAGNDLTESGAAVKMIWYPKNAAFRAGGVDADQWDIGKIGQYSFASGFNTKASGYSSIAMGYASEATELLGIALGYESIASGQYAFAAGQSNTASGESSVAIGRGNVANNSNALAIGYNNLASGTSAIAIGDNTDATGNASFATNESTLASGSRSAAFNLLTTASGTGATAFGVGTVAKSQFSMATGIYNDISDNPTGSVFDRVFQIGNGSSTTARSNVITVLRNGNTGIGVLQPNAKLEIRGALGFSSTTKRWEMNYDSTAGYFYIDEFGTGRHFIIDNGGQARLSQSLLVQGNKGIIRNIDGTQLKKLSATVTVAAGFALTETKTFAVAWPESFSSAPEAYVGNVTSGGGGWAEVIMTLGSVTNTGAVLYVYNARPAAASVNFTVKIIAIGPQ